MGASTAPSGSGENDGLVVEDRTSEADRWQASWAKLTGRQTPVERPTTGAGPVGKPGADQKALDRAAKDQAQRREAARKEDTARRHDRGRGPRL